MAAADVELEFVDAKSGRTFARAVEKAKALPDFVVGARLTIGPDIRKVVEVTPPDRATWAASGKLVVRLERVGAAPFVDDGRRYTLPTLAESLPPLVEREGIDRERLLVLHEDDWRQVELFGAAAKSKVKQQLRAIDEVRRRFQDERGFLRMHLRDVANTLEHAPVTLDDLEQVLPAATEKLPGIGQLAHPGVFEDGVAWAFPTGGVLYGVVRDGRAECLAYRRPQLPGGEADDAMILGAILTRFGLTLVDWCGPWIVTGDRAELTKWFETAREAA